MPDLISADDFIGKEHSLTAWAKDNVQTIVAWAACIIVVAVAWGVHTAEFKEVDAHVDDLVVTLNKMHAAQGAERVHIAKHSSAIAVLDRRVQALESVTSDIAKTLTRVEVLVAKLDALVLRLDRGPLP